MKNIVLFSLFFIVSLGSASAQCKHSVKVSKASLKNNSGIVEVEITTSGSFVCSIFQEKGTGSEKSSFQSGSGSKKIVFSNLDPAFSYLVEAEFINEENRFCRKLQRSQIILQAK